VELSPFAKRIALGRLDLDDFGAELREEFPGEGSGNQLSQLDHPQPFQGLCHSSLRSTKACARVPVSTYSSSPAHRHTRAIRRDSQIAVLEHLADVMSGRLAFIREIRRNDDFLDLAPASAAASRRARSPGADARRAAKRRPISTK